MDLHLMQAEPSERERAAIDALLGEPGSDSAGAARDDRNLRVTRAGHAVREQRHMLLPALHALQSAEGWISQGGLGYVCERLTIPPAEAYGVATFYAMFSVEPRPTSVVHVCDDLACRLAGAEEVCAKFEASKPGAWVRSPCLGMCDQAPALFMQQTIDADEPGQRNFALRATEEFVAASTTGGGWVVPGAGAVQPPEGLRLLRRIYVVDPASLDDYVANGGGEALHKALEIGPEATIKEIKDSKLMGRGGAAFPTGVKWEAVAGQSAQPHYFVCNADESEPGTFKDRIVMESDPFSVVESLTIAGLSTGCENGYVYIRGEYPQAQERLDHAIAEARRAGWLGSDVLGSGKSFDVEIRRGAGAYICGEETALFNSIEGKRGEPRNKPPFPVQRGLFGKPTGINNVETLINVLEILKIGGAAYAQIGTEGSTGTRLFCLSGHVERPGLYEVEFGATLDEVLRLAGGFVGEPKAVLLGGAAGGFLGPDRFDVRLTFEDSKAGGYALGSGVVMAFNSETDMVDIVLRIARFFRDESCGQCVPCRVGTVRQEEALHRLVAGRTLGSPAGELALLQQIAQVMRDASICGLGQTAASAVQSAISTLGMFAEVTG